MSNYCLDWFSISTPSFYLPCIIFLCIYKRRSEEEYYSDRPEFEGAADLPSKMVASSSSFYGFWLSKQWRLLQVNINVEHLVGKGSPKICITAKPCKEVYDSHSLHSNQAKPPICFTLPQSLILFPVLFSRCRVKCVGGVAWLQSRLRLSYTSQGFAVLCDF